MNETGYWLMIGSGGYAWVTSLKYSVEEAFWFASEPIASFKRRDEAYDFCCEVLGEDAT